MSFRVVIGDTAEGGSGIVDLASASSRSRSEKIVVIVGDVIGSYIFITVVVVIGSTGHDESELMSSATPVFDAEIQILRGQWSNGNGEVVSFQVVKW